jgi:monofunctional glycosyltransferase
MPASRDRPRDRARAGRWILWSLLTLMLAPVVLVVIYRFVPPPVTALMLIRAAQGEAPRQEWVPLSRIAPALGRAVIAAEDQKFCRHHGFDWQALDEAWRDWRAGRHARGASTLTMQTAKNLFLWPGRSLIRKAAEAYLVLWIELLWSKARILEVYLNIVEWGPGLYGAEAAAAKFFSRSAAELSADEAARLAAVLPNPLRYSPKNPGPYTLERAAIIRVKMSAIAVADARGCR